MPLDGQDLEAGPDEATYERAYRDYAARVRRIIAEDPPPEEGVRALVVEHARWVLDHPAVSRHLLEGQDPSDGTAPRLTPAEVRVCALLAEGLTNKGIAARLFVAPSTVESHLKRVFKKLGMHSRAELAVWASRHLTTPRRQPG